LREETTSPLESENTNSNFTSRSQKSALGIIPTATSGMIPVNMLDGSNRKPSRSFIDVRTKSKRPLANRKKNSLGTSTLLILIVVGVLAMVVDLKELQLVATVKVNNFISDKKIKGKETTRGATTNDGCGLVNNQYSSTWIPLSGTENEDVQKLQECLQRTVPGSWPGAVGYHNINPRAFGGQLNCSIPVTFDTVRSALSQYKTVWMHGDSVMAQTFYTLGCMMNSSIAEWNGTRIGEIIWATGLGYNGPEQFTYTHSDGLGGTKFMYSRFGKSWGLDKNLYEDDFPLAVRTLTSHDAILTTGAALHNHADAGSKWESDVDFIAEHSKMTNATTFFFEPTTEEWPSSNGMYIPGLQTCQCHPLT
jgi:hypothetical protein